MDCQCVVRARDDLGIEIDVRPRQGSVGTAGVSADDELIGITAADLGRREGVVEDRVHLESDLRPHRVVRAEGGRAVCRRGDGELGECREGPGGDRDAQCTGLEDAAIGADRLGLGPGLCGLTRLGTARYKRARQGCDDNGESGPHHREI